MATINNLCKLFGHKYTKEIESLNWFYGNNLYCSRCDEWSWNMPGDWFDKYGNGVVIDWLTGIRTFFKEVRGWFGWQIYKIKSRLGYDELPF